MIDDFVCELSKVLSIKDWFERGETKDSCPPCMITPLASYYVGVLEEVGETELAEHLKQTYEQGDALTIAEELDRIKLDAGTELKSELEKLDCMAQSFKKSTKKI